MSDYLTFRGQCKPLAEAAVAADPTLTLVRGHYYCPLWNREEQHWWTVRRDGSIYDPSRRQFPSAGMGDYTPFNGIVACSNCGTEKPEAAMNFESRYAFCCYACHGQFVGVL
ncbi:MAG: hypothetical protein ACK5XA_08480 [Tagaea sp.]